MGLYIKSHWDYCQGMKTDSKSSSPAEEKLPTLSTTSYAILGFLNRRPMSAYDLTQAMGYSLAGAFWMRTRSKLFVEPKKLVAHGFATVEHETKGRKRAVYSVTKKGRAALRDWIGQPTQPMNIEAEVVLKVLAARSGKPEDIVAVLREQLAVSIAYLEAQEPVFQTWMDGGMRFPEEMHLSAVGLGLQIAIRRAIRDWMFWAIEIFESWNDTQPSEEKTAWAMEVYKSMLPMFDSINDLKEGRIDRLETIDLQDLPPFPLDK